MDFEKVLELLISELDREKVSYALIGGFAMGALGIMRATMDLDILINYLDLPKVEKIMQKFGYKRTFKSENVSQYVSDLKIFGQIDFLHAFREKSLSALRRVKKIPVFDGKLEIRVVGPEDLVGFKLQALTNDPLRETREYADIEAIMECFGVKLDWDLVSEYFKLFDKKQRFMELRRRYGKTG